MFVKRPNIDEDEDDLMRQQQEFLAKKSSRSSNETPSIDHNESKESKSESELHDNHDIVKLDFKIVEKNPNPSSFFDNNDKPPNGFPEAPCLSLDLNQPIKKSTRSLYAQKYLKQNAENSYEDDKNTEQHSLITGIGLGSKNWQKEITDIRRENETILNQMNNDDIERLRAEVMSKLSSKTIEFLKSKKFPYRSTAKSNEDTNVSNKNNSNDNSKQIPDETNIIEKIPIDIDDIRSGKYVHMDVIEKEKLEWIGDIKNEPKDKNKSESSSLDARFDFEGALLMDVDENIETNIDTIHQGLHHHGDEPERAGYTINELFMYLQSKFPSQKLIALKVFEKIIIKAYQGFYDSCFNMNLIEYLLKESQLILITRTCLDETSDTVWKQSIQTLKALICNTIYDELFLDRGYIIFEDYLNHGHRIDLDLKPKINANNDKDNEDHNDSITDQQLLANDVINCLLNRTSILQRLAYLMNNQLSCNADDAPFHENILDILIRIARHSSEASASIVNCKNLIDAIVLNLNHNKQQSYSAMNSVLIMKIFKLLRCCISSIQNSKLSLLRKLFDRLDQIDIIDMINFTFLLVPEDYIDLTTDNFKKNIPLVSIESLRLWIKLLSFNYNHDCQFRQHNLMTKLSKNFGEMFPFLMKILNYCHRLQPVESSLSMTFDFQFMSCVILLIKMYHEILDCPDDYVDQYCFDLFNITMKWFTIIHNEAIVPNFDCCLCILVMIEFILKHLKIDKDRLIRIAIEKLLGNNERFVRKLIDSCMKNSNTQKLNTCGHVRDSSNLPSYGSIYLRGYDSVPLFRNDSSIFLLQSLIRIASIVEPKILNEKLSSKTFDYLFNYIEMVVNNIFENRNDDISSNIFDLIEINIIAQACIVTIETIDLSLYKNRKILHTIMNFSLMINIMNDNEIRQKLLQKCLFNEKFYNNNPHFNLKDVQNLYDNYSKYNHNCWIFDPLLQQVQRLSKQDSYESFSMIELNELITFLSFIEYLEENYSKYFYGKILTTKTQMFEILCLVFVVNEDYFFYQNIDQILRRFLSKLINNNNDDDSMIKCTKDDVLPAIFGMSIIDLYNKFVDQFINSSYFNQIFCNYLFVYFRTNCSSYFRCHFLSEYSFSSKIFNFKLDQLLIPIDSLLYPIETNLEILEIYLKTLLSECCSQFFENYQNSVLCRILVHHLHYALLANDALLKHEFQNENCNDDESMKLKLQYEKLLRSIEMSANVQLKHYLLNYHSSKFD